MAAITNIAIGQNKNSIILVNLLNSNIVVMPEKINPRHRYINVMTTQSTVISMFPPMGPQRYLGWLA